MQIEETFKAPSFSLENDLKDKHTNDNSTTKQIPHNISFFLFSHEQTLLNLPGHPSAKFSYIDSINFKNDFPFYDEICDRKNRKILQVPIAQLYGNDRNGKSVCLHIHGYFPYFYLKVNTIEHLFKNDSKFLDKFIDTIEECYYTLYSVSDKQKKFLMGTTPIILKYELIYRKDIYGYHVKEEPFLRIYYFNPKMIRKLINILESGLIMDQEFVIYEGHLTHFMRLYSDLDVQGLREVKLFKYSIRRNENKAVQALISEREVNSVYSNPANTFNSMARASTCDIEVDVYYKHILNYIFLQEEQNDENFKEICSNLELQKNCNKRHRECQVQITKSLEMFWKEERQMQEDLFGIKEMKSTQTVDYTDNIESLFIDEEQEELDSQKEFTFNNYTFNGFNQNSKFLEEQKLKRLKEKEELLKKVNHDVYWINQLSLSKNINKQFRQHIEEYIESRKHQQELPQSIYLNQEIMKNYHSIQKKRTNDGVHSILNRNKQYGKRTAKYYQKLLNGETKELDLLPENQPDFEQNEFQEDSEDQESLGSENNLDGEDEEDDEEQEDLDQDEDQDKVERISPNCNQFSFLDKFQIRLLIEKMIGEKGDKMNTSSSTKKRNAEQYLKSSSHQKEKEDFGQNTKKHIKLQYEQQKNQNNIQIWRDNFSAVKNNIHLEDSVFSFCQFCKQIKHLCRCSNSESDRQDLQRIAEFFTKPSTNYDLNQRNKRIVKHNSKCPTFAQIMETGIASKVEHQYAYYENLDDLFEHYNLKNKQIQKNLLFAQILEKDLIKVPQHKQNYVGIKNELKLPRFFRAYISEDYESSQEMNKQNQIFVHQRKCPTFQEIETDSHQKSLKEKNKTQLFTPATKSWLSPFAHSEQKNKSLEQQQKENSKLMQYHEDVTMYTFEVFAKSAPDMLPNPQSDSITFIVFDIQNFKRSELKTQGVIFVDEENYQEPVDKLKKYYGLNEKLFQTVIVTRNEEELLLAFLKQIHTFNIDVITGWDIEKKSLFYLSHRCWQLGIDIMDILSRCPKNSYNILRTLKMADCLGEQLQHEYSNGQHSEESFNFDSNQSFKLQNVAMSNIKKSHRSAKQTGFFANFKLNFEVNGRMILNMWRIVKHDYKLFCYELESVVYYLFQERIPIFSNWSLTQMYNHQDLKQRICVFEYMMTRLMKTKEIIDHIQIINTCTEESKLYGFDFQSAINRGHQFRIEHIMNRVTDMLGYKLMSASRYGVQTQRMLECSPLTLEPPKLFYVDPVIVLDFISLYPSIMMAYNLCFSTCLGYIDENFLKGGIKRVGVQKECSLDIDELLKSKNYDIDEFMKDIFVAPNKVAYVKKHVREGVLSLITHEFFFTRQFIKKNMNKYKQNPLYTQIYNKLQQRQKSLKLFMCVIFGYTGATFSGRMPLGDLADSIIQIGRFLLNQVINLVNTTKKWNAQVIYGDTDSVFVNLKGASVKDAIKIGKEIESEVSKMFPYPLKLKYEKTYREMVIVTKKRYAGFQQENENDEPKFEVKGLEVMRKDGCQGLSIIMRDCLEILLKQRNLSAIKLYLNGQWQKLLNDQFPYRDLMIGKECKLENYTMPPPHAKIALNEMKRDPQTKPKYGQRIKYFIISRAESSKLNECVVSVSDFMKEYRHQLNFNEYLEKQINSALSRLFSTFDVDIDEWVSGIKKNEIKSNNLLALQHKNVKGSGTTDYSKSRKQVQLVNYYQKEECLACSEKTKNVICESCLKDPVALLLVLNQKKKINEINLNKLILKCKECSKITQIEDMPQCIQNDCYTYFDKQNAQETVDFLNPHIEQYTQTIQNLMYDF